MKTREVGQLPSIGRLAKQRTEKVRIEPSPGDAGPLVS